MTSCFLDPKKLKLEANEKSNYSSFTFVGTLDSDFRFPL